MPTDPFSEAQIKYMVDRFLNWRLPQNFNPDAGISFKSTFNEHTPYPMKHEPTGTNLFDASQADAMVRYMFEGLPASPKLENAVNAALAYQRGFDDCLARVDRGPAIDRFHLADLLLCHGEFGTTEGANKAGALRCADVILCALSPQLPWIDAEEGDMS